MTKGGLKLKKSNRLVLGCIEAKICKQIRMRKLSPRSTQCTWVESPDEKKWKKRRRWKDMTKREGYLWQRITPETTTRLKLRWHHYSVIPRPLKGPNSQRHHCLGTPLHRSLNYKFAKKFANQKSPNCQVKIAKKFAIFCQSVLLNLTKFC